MAKHRSGAAVLHFLMGVFDGKTDVFYQKDTIQDIITKNEKGISEILYTINL